MLEVLLSIVGMIAVIYIFKFYDLLKEYRAMKDKKEEYESENRGLYAKIDLLERYSRGK